MGPPPKRSIEPVLSSDATVTTTPLLSASDKVPMARLPRLVSAPARVRLDPPPSPSLASTPMPPSLTSAPVVDTEAPFWRLSAAPAPIEASPVRALFDPSAVLSSMKASLLIRFNCALAARLVISPLPNSIALSKPS